MNNILISNPFLSRTSSPDSEEFLSYQASQFEKAWARFQEDIEQEKEITQRKIRFVSGDSGISISSPEISSTTTSPPTNISTYNPFFSPIFEQDDSMELNWLSQEGFNFDQLDAVSNDVASPGPSGESTIVPSPRDATFSANYVGGGDLDFLPDDMDFNDIFNEDLKKPALLHNDDMLSGTTLNKHFENLPDISLSSILNSSSATTSMEPNRIFVVNTATKQISPEGQEALAAASSVYNTRSTHQRKAAPGKRVVAQSPYQSQTQSQEAVQYDDQEEDVKPNVSQLTTTYGLRRKRNLSTLSTDESPSSSRNSKKPRKYEIEDVNDPSVRNAKAAKLNRDRKKREFNDMKKRAEAAEATVASLRVENDTLKNSLATVSGQLNDLKVKNRTVTGLNCQMSTMKNVFEAILPAMSQKFGRQMAVEVPDSFAQIPAALDESGQLIGGGGAGGLNPDGFNILDESFQMGVESAGAETEMGGASSQTMNSNYFTLHINPQGGKIRLDYDPSKLIRKLRDDNNFDENDEEMQEDN